MTDSAAKKENADFDRLLADDDDSVATAQQLRERLARVTAKMAALEAAAKAQAGGGDNAGDEVDDETSVDDEADEDSDDGNQVNQLGDNVQVITEPADGADASQSTWEYGTRRCCASVVQWFGSSGPVITADQCPRKVSLRRNTWGFNAGGAVYVWMMSDPVIKMWQEGAIQSDPEGNGTRFLSPTSSFRAPAVDSYGSQFRHNYGVVYGARDGAVFEQDVSKASDPTLSRFINAIRQDGREVTPPQDEDGVALMDALVSLVRGAYPEGHLRESVKPMLPLYTELIELSKRDPIPGHAICALYPSLGAFLTYMGTTHLLDPSRTQVSRKVVDRPVLPRSFYKSHRDDDRDLTVLIPVLTSGGMDVDLQITSWDVLEEYVVDENRVEESQNFIRAIHEDPQLVMVRARATITGCFGDHLEVETGKRNREQAKAGQPHSKVPNIVPAEILSFTTSFTMISGDDDLSGYANYVMLVAVCMDRRDTTCRKPENSDRKTYWSLPQTLSGGTLSHVDLSRVVVTDRVLRPCVRNTAVKGVLVRQVQVPTWWSDLLDGDKATRAWVQAALVSPMLSDIAIPDMEILFRPEQNLDDVLGKVVPVDRTKAAVMRGPLGFTRDPGMEWASMDTKPYDADGIQCLIRGNVANLQAASLVFVDYDVVLSHQSTSVVKCLIFAVGTLCTQAAELTLLDPPGMLIFPTAGALAKYAKMVKADVIISRSVQDLTTYNRAGLRCWLPPGKKEDADRFLSTLYTGKIPSNLNEWKPRDRGGPREHAGSRDAEDGADEPGPAPKWERRQRKDETSGGGASAAPRPDRKAKTPGRVAKGPDAEGTAGFNGAGKTSKQTGGGKGGFWARAAASETPSAESSSPVGREVPECPKGYAAQAKILEACLTDKGHPLALAAIGRKRHIEAVKAFGWDKSLCLASRIAAINPSLVAVLNPNSPFAKLGAVSQKFAAFRAGVGSRNKLDPGQTKKLTSGPLLEILRQIGAVSSDGSFKLTAALALLFSLMPGAKSQSVVKSVDDLKSGEVILRRFTRIDRSTFPTTAVGCIDGQEPYNQVYTFSPPAGFSVAECEDQCIGAGNDKLGCTGDTEFNQAFPDAARDVPDVCIVTSTPYCILGSPANDGVSMAETIVDSRRLSYSATSLPWDVTFNAVSNAWTAIPDQAGLLGLTLQWDYGGCTETESVLGESVSFSITDSQHACGSAGLTVMTARLCVDTYCGKSKVFDLDGEELTHQFQYLNPFNTITHLSALMEDNPVLPAVQLTIVALVVVVSLGVILKMTMAIVKEVRRARVARKTEQIEDCVSRLEANQAGANDLMARIHCAVTGATESTPLIDSAASGTPEVEAASESMRLRALWDVVQSGVMDSIDAKAYLADIPTKAIQAAYGVIAPNSRVRERVKRTANQMSIVLSPMPGAITRGMGLLIGLILAGFVKGQGDLGSGGGVNVTMPDLLSPTPPGGPPTQGVTTTSPLSVPMTMTGQGPITGPALTGPILGTIPVLTSLSDATVSDNAVTSTEVPTSVATMPVTVVVTTKIATASTTSGITTTSSLESTQPEYLVDHACLVKADDGVCNAGCFTTESRDCCPRFWSLEHGPIDEDVEGTGSRYGSHCGDPYVLRVEEMEDATASVASDLDMLKISVEGSSNTLVYLVADGQAMISRVSAINSSFSALAGAHTACESHLSDVDGMLNLSDTRFSQIEASILLLQQMIGVEGSALPSEALGDTMVEWLVNLTGQSDSARWDVTSLASSIAGLRIYQEVMGSQVEGIEEVLARVDALNITALLAGSEQETADYIAVLLGSQSASIEAQATDLAEIAADVARVQQDIAALVNRRSLTDTDPFVPLDTACSTYVAYSGLPVVGDTGVAFSTLTVPLPSRGVTACVTLNSTGGRQSICKIRYSDTGATYPAETPYWTGTVSPDYQYGHIWGASTTCSSGYPIGGILDQKPTFNKLLNSTKNNMFCAIERGVQGIGKTGDLGDPPMFSESEVCIPWCVNVNPSKDADLSTYCSPALGLPLGVVMLQMSCFGNDDGALLTNVETDATEGESITDSGVTLELETNLVVDMRQEGYRLFSGNKSFYGPGAAFGQYGPVPGGLLQGSTRDTVWTNAAFDPQLKTGRVIGMSMYWDVPVDPTAAAIATLGDPDSAWVPDGQAGLGGTMRMFPTGIYVEQAPVKDATVILSGVFTAVGLSKTAVQFVQDDLPEMKGPGEAMYLSSYGHTVSTVTKIGIAAGVEVCLTEINTGILKTADPVPTVCFGTYLFPATGSGNPVIVPCTGVPAQACGQVQMCDSAGGDSRCSTSDEICWDRPFSAVKTLNGNSSVIDGTDDGWTGTVAGVATFVIIVIVVVCVIVLVVVACICWRRRGMTGVLLPVAVPLRTE